MNDRVNLVPETKVPKALREEYWRQMNTTAQMQYPDGKNALRARK